MMIVRQPDCAVEERALQAKLLLPEEVVIPGLVREDPIHCFSLRSVPLPPVNCAKAAAALERTICADLDPSLLDFVLTERYQLHLVRHCRGLTEVAAQPAMQREWVARTRLAFAADSGEQALEVLIGPWGEFQALTREGKLDTWGETLAMRYWPFTHDPLPVPIGRSFSQMQSLTDDSDPRHRILPSCRSRQGEGCDLRQALAIVARPASTTKRAVSTNGAPGRVT
ncbi:MAG: hypothetical protein ACK5X5_15785 [bacterium]